MTTRDLATVAVRTALSFRRSLGLETDRAICIYDVAEKAGVQVWFLDASSLEGIYARKPGPAIVLGTQRPAGRRAVTCAHELGHHVFGHGTRVHEYVDTARGAWWASREETLAGIFSWHFLMPAPAVRRVLAEGGLAASDLNPRDAFRLASIFGVSYEALVTHLYRSLNLIGAGHAERLGAFTPQEIRAEVLGRPFRHDLWLANRGWTDRPVDVVVGDLIVVPQNARWEGRSVEGAGDCGEGRLLEAVRPGLSRIEITGSGEALFVRVSRREFVGWSIHRHLEESDGD